MSYQTGEAAILTLIQNLEAYSSSNSLSRANDGSRKVDAMLNSGADYRYVALTPGPFTRIALDIGQTEWQTAWQTKINIYVLNSADHGPEKVLSEERQAIMDKLSAYHELNTSGVIGLNAFTGGEVGEQEVSLGTFIKQEVTLEWVEVTEVTQHD
jgi:hypothetical protein